MARRGENIHKRKDGRWEGRYISSRLSDGKAKYSSVYGKSYKEVKSKLNDKRTEINIGSNHKNNKVTFGQLLDIWIKFKSPGLKESTVIKYSNVIDNHILPELGGFYLESINTSVLNSFIERKMIDGRLDNKGGISSSYARTTMIIIKSALEYAVGENLCTPITLSNIFVPKVTKNNIKILTNKEQKVLNDYVFNNINHTTIGIVLSLYMGLRKGEICALRWSDISFSQNVINVENSLSAVKNTNGKGIHFEVKSTKTDASVRCIPIPKVIIPLLKTAKKESESIYVVSDNSEFINPRTFENRFHKIIQQTGIDNFNFHKLRHTFATQCIEKGMDPKTLSEILGHSSVAITLNLYVHPTMKQKIKQINKLNKQIA